ncbi:MAG: nuclear transport factor 2 family protein [Azospirillaceae bacterium]|nr:nuclear transport factor 2 family protein [Azospirillaceae bacterium]
MRRLIVCGLVIPCCLLAGAGMAASSTSKQPPANQEAGATSTRIPDARAEGEANRQTVLDFYDAFFNKHDLSAADRYVAQDFKAHDPGMADGRHALQDTYAEIFQRSPQAKVEVVRSVAQGDLVMLHVHSIPTPGDRGDAVVDIFRVADGKIVEHWRVSQPVPATANGDDVF